jgi:AraC family transcriptional regulator, regulatory protein of adaptative response / methylated-DNA-[protein]-cysteine methyltransferase
MESMDYRRIEKALEYLGEHAEDQPRLAEVARHVGLSPFHLQRLFRTWAGISPKRFVQYLTLERAKSLLRGSETVLGAAYDSGLSGPGRLHDLFVSVEAVTPGEYRAEGHGLALRYGFHPTPFGEALLATTERGICSLAFSTEGGRRAALESLEAEWPRASMRLDPGSTRPLAERVFARRRSGPPLPLLLKGTNLQVQVWRALLRIPEGSVVSYSDVARFLGRPRAVRAVASAVARNPVAYLIPCHRVIRRVGGFGEYRWGELRKTAILGWEAARSGASA